MDEDRLNMAIRKFLKEVGVTSQREIERIVREGSLQGRNETGGGTPGGKRRHCGSK